MKRRTFLLAAAAAAFGSRVLLQQAPPAVLHWNDIESTPIVDIEPAVLEDIRRSLARMQGRPRPNTIVCSPEFYRQLRRQSILG